MLEVPPTIRLPRTDEIPNNPKIFKQLEKRKKANIVEGYVLKYNTTHELPFGFYAEVNINNSRLWKFFNALSDLLPKEICCIYNLYEEKAIYSPYLSKIEILKLLESYKTELTQDCNLEFGLLFNTEDELEEVFVSDTKYLKIWGNKETIFRQVMHDFSLKEIPNLNFID